MFTSSSKENIACGISTQYDEKICISNITQYVEKCTCNIYGLYKNTVDAAYKL